MLCVVVQGFLNRLHCTAWWGTQQTSDRAEDDDDDGDDDNDNDNDDDNDDDDDDHSDLAKVSGEL